MLKIKPVTKFPVIELNGQKTSEGRPNFRVIHMSFRESAHKEVNISDISAKGLKP